MSNEQLIPSGLGYILARQTEKTLPCGCRYISPYSGCWVRVLVCRKHGEVFPKLDREKVEELRKK